MGKDEGEKNQGNSPTAPSVEKLATIEGGENTKQEQYAGKKILEHMQNKWEEWKCLNAMEKFTGLLVLFTAFYVGISMWQGCQTRDAVNVARDTLIASNRPWVGVSGTKPLGEMISGEPFRVLIRFKNVGNSPGLYVDTQVHFSPLIGVRERMKKVPFMDMSMLPACILPKPQWEERTNGSFLMPGDEPMWVEQPTPDPMNEVTIKFAKGKEYDNPVISKEELGQFPVLFRIGQKDLDDPSIGKKVGLYLMGCVNYFDEFKFPHRTNFCFRYEYAIEEKNRVFSMCEYGNDAD